MLTTRIFHRFSEIPKVHWGALTQDCRTVALEYDLLAHLENSGSISASTGWSPQHVTLWESDRLVAAAPLWLKSHSGGELIFDQGFAGAAAQMGLNWYPKLVGMCPATPVPGYQIATLPNYSRPLLLAHLHTEIKKLAQELGAVSLQFNFCEPGFKKELESLGFVSWTHQHFGLDFEEFSDFDGYLARFDKNQRKNIRREIESMAEQHVSFRMLEGPEVPPDWYALMGRLYQETNDKFGPWAAKFLTPEFFHNLKDIKEHFLLAGAFEGQEKKPFALAFFLRSGPVLLGRYWGSLKELKNLYFNLCYYFPIRWCLEKGMERFDPGVGSSLKVRRGFSSREAHSAHYFFHPGAEELFRYFLPRLNKAERQLIESLNAQIPWKQPT